MRSHIISSRILTILLLSLLVLLAACGQAPATSSSTTKNAAPTATPTQALDAYGTPIAFPDTAAKHIISMVPTISDMLAALHLDSRVIAVDSYTVYPAELASLPKISTSGNYNVEKIVSLKPDLVLSYGEDTKQYDAQLTQLGVHVVDLPSTDLNGILQEMLIIGRLTLTQNTATQVVNQLQQQINSIKAKVAGTTAPKVLLELDYSNPAAPYVYGGGSYADNLLQDANGTNIFHSDTSGAGFPQVTNEAIISANPQVIIVTEEVSYGVTVASVYKRANWSSIAAVQTHRVYQIGPSLIGHPGPRMVQWLQCLAQVLHPDKFTTPLPTYCAATN
jgi:iron complex transport system substrate-binding protein